jgi:hypothetical protein
MRKYYPVLFYVTLSFFLFSLFYNVKFFLNDNSATLVKEMSESDPLELNCPPCDQKDCAEEKQECPTQFIELSPPECPECNCSNCEQYCHDSIMGDCEECYYYLDETGEALDYCIEYIASTDGFDDICQDHCIGSAKDYCDDFIEDYYE